MSGYRPWRIIHVRLDEGTPDVGRDESKEGVYAVFWWRDVPLGAARIPAADLPLPAGAVAERALALIAPAVTRNLDAYATSPAAGPEARPQAWQVDRPLSRLRELVEARCAGAEGLSASVIVCTRDRPDLLARCLDSLEAELGPRDEVVVVDNAPSSDAAQGVAQGRARVRYVREPRPGLDVARNRGVRTGGGDITVFCDDDVVIEAGWLRRLKAPFLDPAIGAVTGLVLPASLDTEAEFVFETYWSFGRGFEPKTFGPVYFERHRAAGVPAWEIGAGASMAFRRSVLAEVGGFDERLDAGAAGCSGDSEMWYRILAAGHSCRYEPTAVSHHKHRGEMHELRQQIYSYMRGHTAALLVQFEQHGHLGNLRRALVSLPTYYLGKLVRHAIGSDPRRTQTLGREVAGWLAGIRYYLRQPRRTPPSVVEDT